MEEGQLWRQLVAGGVANLGILSTGFCQGWSSPVSEKFQRANQSPLGYKVNTEELSWIASIVVIGIVLGSVPAGFLSSKLGRKWSLISSTIPMLVGMILIATPVNIWMVYVGRLLAGISIGIIYTVSPMYCAEISTDGMRGALGSFFQLFTTLGVLLAYSVGPYVSYLGLASVGIGQLVIFIFLAVFLPESPVYLLSKTDRDGAAVSLMRLRGLSRDGVEDELDKITEDVNKTVNSTAKFSDLFERGNLKALNISCMLILAQQFSGIIPVLFFMSDIFAATGSSLNAAVASITVGFLQVAASTVTPLVVDRLGRRILLLTSSAGSALGLLVLGIYFYLSEADSPIIQIPIVGIIPIMAMIVFIMMYGIGLGPLPWVVMAELFAVEVKSLAAPIVTIFLGIWTFLVSRFFNPVAEAVGLSYTFWIFTACCVLSFLFTLFVVPETKGKSYHEIQALLRGTSPETMPKMAVDFPKPQRLDKVEMISNLRVFT